MSNRQTTKRSRTRSKHGSTILRYQLWIRSFLRCWTPSEHIWIDERSSYQKSSKFFYLLLGMCRSKCFEWVEVCHWKLKFFQNMIHCGQLLIVLEDRSWKSLWEMNTFHSQHQKLAQFFMSINQSKEHTTWFWNYEVI